MKEVELCFMQGHKDFTPKLLYTVNIDMLVSNDNFYRRLHQVLDLRWLYKATEKYYGSEGQASIDPVVFFKICLVGYLNGIYSDRKLIEFCKDSLSVRLFLGYDIDEELPWHSTISRTRQLYGEEEFKTIFEQVFKLCADTGMVSGKTQAIDGAFLKANASTDSLEVKQVSEGVEEHLLHSIKANTGERKPVKKDRADDEQKKMKGNTKEQTRKLKALNTRYQRQKELYKKMPGRDATGRYLSNSTHYSPVDPDARIAIKPGKPRGMYYSGQIAVDTKNHVITHAETVHADNRDGQYLQQIISQVKSRLEKEQLPIRECLADGAYSSGKNYAFLQQQDIIGYIPLLGGALSSNSEGFTYDIEKDYYTCPTGQILKTTGKIQITPKGLPLKEYFSQKSHCANCPLKEQCLKHLQQKKIRRSIYTTLLDEVKARQQSVKGQIKKKQRSSTVEPVWGTLLNNLGLKRINSRGLKSANQALLMASACYNLKKYMKRITQKVKIGAIALPKPMGETISFIKTALYEAKKRILKLFNLPHSKIQPEFSLS